MKLALKDEKIDVAIIAGNGITHWPSVGTKTLSAICSEMGLSVALYGGDRSSTRGVIPLPTTGALVIVEEHQGSIRRIHARSVIRMVPNRQLPDPFPGWRSSGLVPLDSAQTLIEKCKLGWEPGVVILGTGNRALRFGSYLLENRFSTEVACIESAGQWGAKTYAGWEVEKRNFEMSGGKIIYGTPVMLQSVSSNIWDFRLRDDKGIRVLRVSRVISAGPFRDMHRIREYPPGSLLFEFEQTARSERAADLDGWVHEEELGRWLGAKIVKSLELSLGRKKQELEWFLRRAKIRLKGYRKHFDEPFSLRYEGKWVAPSIIKQIQNFEGVPSQAHQFRSVAAIECFENIPCNLCEKSCPESAIKIIRSPLNERSFLIESDCTACGACVLACPSQSITLIQDHPHGSTTQLTLPWRGKKEWKAGERAALLNRAGDQLGTGRVASVGEHRVEVDVPSHLFWEARAIASPRSSETGDDTGMSDFYSGTDDRIQIELNGQIRRVRKGLTISLALFELGIARTEDTLLCSDGSCGLCQVSVNGIKQLGCQTPVQSRMNVKTYSMKECQDTQALCPCKSIQSETVAEKLKQGNLHGVEAVIDATHVGSGKCHGRICSEPFRRLLVDHGMDAVHWVDWRFPSIDWSIAAGDDSEK